MIIDSSAIVAIIADEPERARLEDSLAAALVCRIGAPTLVETTMVLTGRFGDTGRLLLGQLLQHQDADIVPFGSGHWLAAQHAFVRYGKGRHPAGLNFGDCLTYAIASLSGEPLLCIGDDFIQTDLDLVDLSEGEIDA